MLQPQRAHELGADLWRDELSGWHERSREEQISGKREIWLGTNHHKAENQIARLNSQTPIALMLTSSSPCSTRSDLGKSQSSPDGGIGMLRNRRHGSVFFRDVETGQLASLHQDVC